MRNWLVAASSLLVLSCPAIAQNIFKKAPPEVEEALLARVNQFYSLYQHSKFRQAEALVAEQSRDLYYGMSKVPIRGFKVENIDWGDEFKTAKVLVACRYVTPRTANAELYVPVTGNWRIMDGQWYLLIESRTTSPWGPMTFEDPNKSKPERFQRPTVDTVTGQAVSVNQRKLVFPRRALGAVSQTVVITNNLPGPIRLELEPLSLKGVNARLSSTNVQPKDHSTLQVEYDPDVARPTGVHQIRIWLQPMAHPLDIQIQFE